MKGAGRCLIEVLLLLFASSLWIETVARRAPSSEGYDRTVSYSNDVVVRCPNKDDRGVKIVTNQAAVDIWRIGTSGEVDMQMSRALSAVVLHYIPKCRIVVESVETHVQIAEEELERSSHDDAQTDWEKAAMEALMPERIHLSKADKQELELLAKMESDSEKQGMNWFKKYHGFRQILDWYQSLAKHYSSLVRYVPSIGVTVEGRRLAAVHITASTNPGRHRIYLQCLIHAREWISGSTCMYITRHLAANFNKDDKVTKLLKSVEFILVPVVNPDGYVYTWKHNRLWRKNRRLDVSGKTSCFGVDLNRNYPAGWGVGGRSSNKPCSNTYHGPQEASEPETRATIAYFKANGPIVAAIDFHSYGQLILRPWGYKATASSAKSRDNQLKKIGDSLVKAIKKTTSKMYKSEHSIDLYQACGIAGDWFYSDDATKTNKGYRAAAFTIELRDQGGYGFLLPASQIISTGKEAVAAILQLAEDVTDSPLASSPSTSSQNNEYM